MSHSSVRIAFLCLSALVVAACGELPAFVSCDEANPCDVDRMCAEGICVARPVESAFDLARVADAAPDAVGCAPSGDEICGDGEDNDCDDKMDEGFTYGEGGPRVGEPCDAVGECGTGQVLCGEDGQSATCSTDPGGPAFVGGVERCDGLDNNCDGVVDDGLMWREVAVGSPCLGDSGCGEGTVICGPGAEPVCDTLTNAVDETCNAIDDDCDGTVDEGLVWNELPLGEACMGVGACGVGVVECFNALAVCSVNGDGSGFGGVDELCDLLDNDCDGEIDEGFFADDAQIGAACTAPGLCGEGQYLCADEQTGACSTAAGQPGSPSAPELCNGLDDDCDGTVDNGLMAADGTALGGTCSGIGRCPDGVYQCAEDQSVQCSTLPPSPLAPTLAETCNGVDDDCDGFSDNGLFWEDIPVGQPCDPIGECGEGLVLCDPEERAICSTAPGGPEEGVTPELCDAADNDCDGAVDEDFRSGDEILGEPCTALGACGDATYDCAVDHGGVVCATAPGGPRDRSRPETCNGVDDDCDGATDEGFATPEGAAVGAVCDGLGACGEGVVECVEAADAVRCSTDAGGSAFAPADELCNGLDDDCNGETDETDPSLCLACAVDGGTGICGQGAFLCEAGALVCVPHLPPAEGAPTCDGLDNDCDTRTDEAAEAVSAPVGAEERVLTACGLAPLPDAGGDPLACAAAPNRLRPDCGAWHGCLDPLCALRCRSVRDSARGACDRGCADPNPLVRSACLRDCRAEIEADDVVCRRACDPQDPVASGFVCDGGAAGAACTPVCPADYLVVGGRCVPVGELCNNGVDDDHDGLIDGVLAGPDPCAASLTPAAAPWPVAGQYTFALDREEVSHRAWLHCVQSGCCQSASGRVAKLAEQGLNNNPNGQRPADDARGVCAGPPSLAGPGAAEAALDLPVTGVSWCQARDYCHWAGKRLVTELEHTYAAAGNDPLRQAPWDPAVLTQCEGDQRCKSANCPPGDPTCDAFELCASAPPVGFESVRRACYAHYALGVGGCGEGDLPTPVWSNEDGVSPDGAVNLLGNVAEWTYDWATPTAGLLPTDGAVGPACGADALGVLPRRVVRGGHLSTEAADLDALTRDGLHPAWRSGLVGFRCARTVDPAGNRCSDDIANVTSPGELCLPPALSAGRNDVLCGPEFASVGAFPPDDGACGGVRAETGLCAKSVSRFCPMEGGIGCQALVVRRFSLAADRLPGFPQALGREISALFNTAWAPAGGDSLAILNGPADYLRDGVADVEFGSALSIGADLRWLGTVDGIDCDPVPRVQGLSLTLSADGAVSACGAGRGGEIWTQDVPVRLRFSALGLSGRFEGPGESLAATVGLVVSRADADVSILGGERLQDLLERTGVVPGSLCRAPLNALSGCVDEALGLPGCDVDGTCTDPALCEGWVLPFDVEAVRLSRAIADGAIAPLACP